MRVSLVVFLISRQFLSHSSPFPLSVAGAQDSPDSLPETFSRREYNESFAVHNSPRRFLITPPIHFQNSRPLTFSNFTAKIQFFILISFFQYHTFLVHPPLFSDSFNVLSDRPASS